MQGAALPFLLAFGLLCVLKKLEPDVKQTKEYKSKGGQENVRKSRSSECKILVVIH